MESSAHKCYCDCSRKESLEERIHKYETWEAMKEWADFVIRIKEFILAVGVILTLIITIRAAFYFSSSHGESFDLMSKGMVAIGKIIIGNSDVQSVINATQSIIPQKTPEELHIMRNADDALQNANNSVKSSFSLL